MHAQVPSPPRRRPLILLLVALLAALGLILVFALLLRSATRPKPTPLPSPPPATAPAQTPTATAGAAVQATSLPTTAPPPTADPNLAAIVNGEAIDAGALRVMASSDRVMAGLLGLPEPQETVLDRLINDVLVLQAARQAGFSVPASEAAQALATFMEQRGIEQATLQQALAAAGVSWEQFQSYFRTLITVDRFSRQQAAAAGVDVSAYLAGLQHKARISYGAAAASGETPPATPTPLVSATAVFSGPQNVADADTLAVVERLAATPVSTPAPAAKRGTAQGQLAPDFELPLVGSESGETLSWSDLLGHPTVLSFTVTWCPYCRKQTPTLVEGYERWRAQGVQFVGIDVKEERAVVAAYAAQNHISYPIVLDHDGAVAERYGVRGFPITYFLDAEGRVLARQIGVITKEKIDQWIKSHEDAS